MCTGILYKPRLFTTDIYLKNVSIAHAVLKVAATFYQLEALPCNK